jgi:hypothetical protein
MLRQTICTACEKVIISASGEVSLINLFNKMHTAVPEGVEIPRDAATPARWSIFAAWDPEPGDEQINYMMCVDILFPDGHQLGTTSKEKIKIESGRRCQVTANINAFPIGQDGTVKARVWVEVNGERVTDVTEIRVEVQITRTPQPAVT